MNGDMTGPRRWVHAQHIPVGVTVTINCYSSDSRMRWTRRNSGAFTESYPGSDTLIVTAGHMDSRFGEYIEVLEDWPVDPLIFARKPWLVAESESIWSITGNYCGGGGFTNCLAMVLPFDTTDGHRLFAPIHPSLQEGPGSPYQFITGEQITRGRRLILVEANDPTETYFADEQDFIR